MTMHLFMTQEFVLKSCGFLPLTSDRFNSYSPRARLAKYFLQKTLTVIGVCFLLGCFYDTVIHIVAVLYVFFQAALDDPNKPPAKRYKADLLGVLSNLPFCTIHLRGFLVLLLFFRKRHNWSKIVFKLDQIITGCLPVESDPTNVIKKWARISVFLSIFTLLLHVFWEVIETIYYLNKEPDNYGGEYTKIFDPLPIKIRTYVYLIVYQLFCTVPYILSQQIYTLMIVVAGVLSESVGVLLKDVQNAQYGHPEIKTLSGKWLRVLELTTTADDWLVRYRSVVRLVHQVNQSFSWILFAIYGLDFITVLGFAAGMASGARTLDAFFFLFACASLFASYGTVYLIPMIKLHEKGLELPFALHQLRANVAVLTTDNVLDHDERTAERISLLNKLDFLQTSAHRHPCAFDAAQVFRVTREVLVRTVTLNVSLVVLIKQLMDKDDKNDTSAPSTMHV